MGRAREARLAEFEFRRGTEKSTDGRDGDLVATGRLDVEVANWLPQLKAAVGVDDTYSIYCNGELAWQVKPDDDDEAPTAVSPKVAPRDLDSIDSVLAERQNEVDRLALRATALEQQLAGGESRLRQLQEDLSAKQLDLARERERHGRELAALDADLERRRQLDAHDRVRLANDLEGFTKGAQAERTRLADELEALTKSYQAQSSLLSTVMAEEFGKMQKMASELKEIAAAEVTTAASSKAAATNATAEVMEALHELQETAAESLRPEKEDAGKTEMFAAGASFIKKDLAGVLINLANIFGPRRAPKPEPEGVAEDE